MRYTDETLMSFGEFKDQKLANVPASRLIWYYENGLKEGPLRVYIEENLEHLKMEAKMQAKQNNR